MDLELSIVPCLHHDVSKQTYHLLKSSTIGKKHHLVGLSLEVIMDKFNTLVSPYCHDFVSIQRPLCFPSSSSTVVGSQGNQSVCFQDVHRPSKQWRWACREDLGWGEGMENSWIMFDHVKHFEGLVDNGCHMYDNRYYQVLTIMICNPKMVQHKYFLDKIWILSWWRMEWQR